MTKTRLFIISTILLIISILIPIFLSCKVEDVEVWADPAYYLLKN